MKDKNKLSMKIQITKKNIIITPAPTRNKKNGIRVYLSVFNTGFCWGDILPEATTDIIKGQRKYSLPKYFVSIKKIEF